MSAGGEVRIRVAFDTDDNVLHVMVWFTAGREVSDVLVNEIHKALQTPIRTSKTHSCFQSEGQFMSLAICKRVVALAGGTLQFIYPDAAL